MKIKQAGNKLTHKEALQLQHFVAEGHLNKMEEEE